jgi:hypothetical protein
MDLVLLGLLSGAFAASQWRPGGTWLLIEVHDADPRPPRPRRPAGLDDSGFGFVLMDAMAGEWGVHETATGKAVWAELDTRQR